LADSPELRRDLAVYIRFGAAAKAARDRLLQQLGSYTGQENIFHSLTILSAENGQVVISANPKGNGKPLLDFTKFSGRETTPLITPIYYSPDWQAPTIVILYPLLSSEGEQMGILAGQL